MTNGADNPKPMLVLDFDGTVCIGDSPVWAYADAVLDSITEIDSAAGARLRHEIQNQLAAFLDGDTSAHEYLDGYDAVAQLTAPHTTPERLQSAYATSRRALATGTLTVHTPDGLTDFLGELHGSVTTVLVTNAPGIGVAETTRALGLDAVIDRVITGAGKPDGWEQLLPELINDRPPATAMVVGDIWANDIAIPLRFGCATAYIDRFDQRQGEAHLVARDFPALYPGIRQWAKDPLGFLAAHTLQRSSQPQPSTTATSTTPTSTTATSTTPTTE